MGDESLAENGHNRIGVTVVGKNLYLKPHGYATQDNCLGIPAFLEAMFRRGCARVAFDLEECDGMDSSFLGVIADAATNLPGRQHGTVVILNADEQNRKELATVGLLPLIEVLDEPIDAPEGFELEDVDFMHFPCTEQERIEEIKRLHETLCHLSEHNKEKFGRFVSMLDAELKQANETETTPAG